ncbi:hypothetical protein [uncultured Croceitalea sp.]|uniref:hypothetical protein n=1 Tax=uncultured Croceitalea sp. TaxID=1798908 RepID=UPI003305D779
MKYLFLIAFFYSLISKAQEFKSINEHLKTVQTSKASFRQELKPLEESMFQYSVVQIDTKGREEEIQYNFSFSDIDQNTVRSITKKDLISVQLLVKNRQKLVQVVTNGGDKVSYTNQFEFLATNAENGKVLERLIKQIIPKAVLKEENRLALNGYQAHINWLLKNLSDVELPKKQIIQKSSVGKIPGKLILDQTFNTKSKSKNELREFNLAIMNPSSIGYQISGEEFIISLDTRRGVNGIKYVEDGTQKNYDSTIKLYAKSIANGKDLYKVLRSLIPLSKTVFKKSWPTITTPESALKFLNAAIAEVGTTEEILTQNLTIQDNITQLKLTETKPNESTEFIYRFNFADINANNIDYDGQRDRLFAVLPIKKSVNFIQFQKNGELQNYTKDTRIYFNTIEDAIIGTKALQSLANIYEDKISTTHYSTTSAETSVAKLNSITKKVKIGEDNYDIFIELIDEKTTTIKITTVFSNLKKSIETVQEFSLKDINPKNCTINVKGKHVLVELNTKHLEKIVKTYLDGAIKPYQYKISIEVKGIEEARQVVGIFKKIIEKT